MLLVLFFFLAVTAVAATVTLWFAVLVAVTTVTVAVRRLNLVPKRLGVPLQLRNRRSVEATQSKHHNPL